MFDIDLGVTTRKFRLVRVKVCAECGEIFHGKGGRKFCSMECRDANYSSVRTGIPCSEEHKKAMRKPKSLRGRANMSKAAKEMGKWVGENNPNYQAKAIRDPEVWPLWLAKMKEKGNCWGETQRKEHAEKMSGPSNKMRGRFHTKELKEYMSELKLQQYREGIVKFTTKHSSNVELEIGRRLKSWGIEIEPQFQIKGLPYMYDYYIPSKNLILEFNGDYWHANPKKYKSGTMLKIRGKGTFLVDDIWTEYEKKVKLAEENGYKVVILWEYDFKKFGEEALRKCLD